MIRNTIRKARKQYRCEYGSNWAHDPLIRPGDVYLYSVASPDHDDLGNPKWWPLKVCVACALVTDAPDDIKATLVRLDEATR